MLDADPSQDSWSLGAVVFEMLAGMTLFRKGHANDELVDKDDLNRLFVCDTMRPSPDPLTLFQNLTVTPNPILSP